MPRIKIVFKKQYQGIKEGQVRNFPAPISRVLIRKGYANPLNTEDLKTDEKPKRGRKPKE